MFIWMSIYISWGLQASKWSSWEASTIPYCSLTISIDVVSGICQSKHVLIDSDRSLNIHADFSLPLKRIYHKQLHSHQADTPQKDSLILEFQIEVDSYWALADATPQWSLAFLIRYNYRGSFDDLRRDSQFFHLAMSIIQVHLCRN